MKHYQRELDGEDARHASDGPVERMTLRLVAGGADWLSALAQASQEAGHDRGDLGTAPGKSTLTARLPTAARSREGLAADRQATGDDIDASARQQLDRAAVDGGMPLPDDLRRRLERELRADLGGVRVHTGGEADSAAQSISARAYTVGRDIYFRAGAYDPSSVAGQRLIAHEVVHTIQAPVAAAATILSVSQPDDAAEREADAFAEAFGGALAVNDVSRQEERDAAAGNLGERAQHASATTRGTQIQRVAEPSTAPPRLGPEIQPGNGTTAELQAERRRLVAERDNLLFHVSDPFAVLLYPRYRESIEHLDLRLAERGNSSAGDAAVELIFDGATLHMTGAAGRSWPAVSGRPDDAGRFDLSPAKQHAENRGPLPAGMYWIDARELTDLQHRWLYAVRFERSWGTHRVTIHPFDSTHTFGRGGFFIHGGVRPGSAGCIDLTTGMPDFARALGATPPGLKVKLTVAYPGQAKEEAPGAAVGGALPDARVQLWVDRAASCYRDKKAAGKMSQPFKVADLDAWLAELSQDQASTQDPAQRRVLAGVQFQFETAKRGTDYQFGSPRDYDLEKTFDCSEAVQWMMKRAGFEEVFGETAPSLATQYMRGIIKDVFGGALRSVPRTGDIMLWSHHTAIVTSVREADRLFYTSHIGGAGSYFIPYDLEDPNKVDPARNINLGATVWSTLEGFWAPEDATLPNATGTATTKASGGTMPRKHYRPSVDAYAESEFAVGVKVELLKHAGSMWLVRPPGSKGAAWVRAANLELTLAANSSTPAGGDVAEEAAAQCLP